MFQPEVSRQEAAGAAGGEEAGQGEAAVRQVARAVHQVGMGKAEGAAGVGGEVAIGEVAGLAGEGGEVVVLAGEAGGVVVVGAVEEVVVAGAGEVAVAGAEAGSEQVLKVGPFPKHVTS